MYDYCKLIILTETLFFTRLINNQIPGVQYSSVIQVLYMKVLLKVLAAIADHFGVGRDKLPRSAENRAFQNN